MVDQLKFIKIISGEMALETPEEEAGIWQWCCLNEVP